MSNLTASFAALKTFYEDARDSIGLYGDVILASVDSQDKKYSLQELKQAAKLKFNVDIPIAMVKTIVKRLKRNNLVNYGSLTNTGNRSVEIAEGGKKRITELDSDIQSAHRKENALLEKLKKHLSGYSIEELRGHLKNFIQNNPFVIANTLVGEQKTPLLDQDIYCKIQQFFIDIRTSDEEGFNYLSNLLFGQLVASHLLNKESDFSLGKVVFYIDTNIFFSLLGLHADDVNQAVKDAIRLILSSKGRIGIFEHTRIEIRDFLRGYLDRDRRYTKDIPVDSVYYRLNRKGYDSQSVMQLIENLDAKLSKLGINIAYARNNDKEGYDSRYYQEFIDAKIGKDSTDRAIDNDCLSIELIRNIRKKKGRDIYYSMHASEAIFLSLDKSIVRFTRKKHSGGLTIAEAFTPEQLIGILWLHNVEAASDTVLHGFLSDNITQQVAVDSKIWNNFVQKLKEFKDRDEITQEDINYLLAHERTKAVLIEGNIDHIENLISPQHIQEIRKEQTNLTSEVVTQKNELEKLEQDYAQQLDRNEKLDRTIAKNAKKEVDRAIVLQKVMACLIVPILLLIVLYIGYINLNNFLGYVISAAGAAGAWVAFSVIAVRKILKSIDRLRNRQIDKRIAREKKRLNLND